MAVVRLTLFRNDVSLDVDTDDLVLVVMASLAAIMAVVREGLHLRGACTSDDDGSDDGIEKAEAAS